MVCNTIRNWTEDAAKMLDTKILVDTTCGICDFLLNQMCFCKLLQSICIHLSSHYTTEYEHGFSNEQKIYSFLLFRHDKMVKAIDCAATEATNK